MNKNIQKQNKEIGMLMKDFVTHTVNFYNHLDEQPVCHPIPPQTITCLEKQTIPAQSRPVQEVYTEMLLPLIWWKKNQSAGCVIWWDILKKAGDCFFPAVLFPI